MNNQTELVNNFIDNFDVEVRTNVPEKSALITLIKMYKFYREDPSRWIQGKGVIIEGKNAKYCLVGCIDKFSPVDYVSNHEFHTYNILLHIIFKDFRFKPTYITSFNDHNSTKIEHIFDLLEKAILYCINKDYDKK